jgi:SET domain-containing protein
MRRVLKPRAVLVGLALAALALATWATITVASGSLPKRGPIIKADPILDRRTEIRPSAIPGSGNGLFALVPIKSGEVIGELGGQLLEEPDLENPSAYLAGLPDCAFNMIPPYRYIDSKDHGGNVSRANFAPRTINGKETNFQNAKIERVCRSPWVLFVATKDIAAGEEIWATYGPNYGYERFMWEPAVRDFFCNLAKIDCSKEYDFEP